MASEIQRMLDQVWQECVANSEPQTVVWSDPGDFDAWMKEAAQAPSPTPEVTVTPEMVNAGRAAAAKANADHYISTFVLAPIYRAMAAVAPNPRHVPYEEYNRLQNVADDYHKLAERLEAERDAALARAATALARVVKLQAKFASVAFTASDLPDPPRRPDGTLAPAPRPLPVLKPAGDLRRVGG